MRIFCESLRSKLDLPEKPERIVSLVSSASETIHAMGLAERVAGVSRYCPRYAPFPESLVVGDYLKVDEDRLSTLKPDLVLVTSGVQLPLGTSLAGKGYPVYVLPLPRSLFGILENVRLIGGLLNEMDKAQQLVKRWEESFHALVNDPPEPLPRVYVELWFGRHQRTVGGLSFIHDLVEAAGGRPLFGSDRRGYFVPDLREVEKTRPEVVLFFDEPEWPMNWQALIKERGWDRWSPPPFVVQSSVMRGQNIIHDGPSMIETAQWLHGQLLRWAKDKGRPRRR
jgi:iron complex transport system substrate-binding protein